MKRWTADVKANYRRPKPAFTHPQLAGMLAEAKPVGPGGMYPEGPSLYGESDSYTGISTKSQQPLCPHGNPLHGERHLGCPTQKPSDSCDRRQRRVQDASNQGVMEASATSLYSSGQDSGIVINRPTRYTAPCPCGHSDHQSSDDSSNGSYEDSLKSSPLEVRHDPSFATPSLPRKSLPRATNQWRRGHSFTEGTMKDDLTQGSPGLLQRAPLASLPPLTTVNHIVYRSHSHRPPPVKKSFRIKDNQGLSTKYNSRLKTLEFKNRGEPLKVEVSIPNLRNSGVPLRSDIQRHL